MESFFHGRLGFDQQIREHLTDAIAHYRKAVELNPLDDSFYHNLGWLFWFLGEQAQALSHFQKAVAIDSNVSLYHISLGLLHERLGEREMALSEYALALRLSPGLLDQDFSKTFLNALRWKRPG